MKLFKRKNVEKYKYVPNEESDMTKLQAIEKKFKRLNLQFTFRGLKYVLEHENTTLTLLRCAQFLDENGNEVIDVHRATFLLIQAGLISSKQESVQDIDKLEEHTYKIMEDWQKKYDLCTLFIQLALQLEKDHFFMSSTTMTLLKTASKLSTYSSGSDLMKSLIVLEGRANAELIKLRLSEKMQSTV